MGPVHSQQDTPQWPPAFNVTVLAAQQTEAGCWLNALATAQYNSSAAQRPEPMDGEQSGGPLCPEASTVGWTRRLRNNSFSKELAVWTDVDSAALTCTINGVPGPVRGGFIDNTWPCLPVHNCLGCGAPATCSTLLRRHLGSPHLSDACPSCCCCCCCRL